MYLPDDAKIADAMRHLDMSDEALFEEISHTDAEHAFVEDAFENGKRRYRVISTNVRSAVCHDQNVRDIFVSGAANRRLMLLCAIADLIHTLGAMSVAAMLVREGLETYCATAWKEVGHA